ncbi:MAG: hypothetical protein ACTSO3_01300 [Candidatus Heimdallarchaeaceae archaeon]
MKTTLNEKEINWVKNNRMITAVKEHRARRSVSLKEAHDACKEVAAAIRVDEDIIPIIETGSGMISPCGCGGNTKITSRNKRNKIYVQVRCNRCGRRGAVYHYFQRYEKFCEIQETINEVKEKALALAVRDWEKLVS